MTDQPLDSNMQGRINNMFSNQDLPAYTSLSEVAAMKAHIQELEKKLLAADISPSSAKDQGQQVKEIKPTQTDKYLSTSTPTNTVQQETSTQKVSFLRSLLTAPTFGDLGKNRIARLQHQILLGLIFSGDPCAYSPYRYVESDLYHNQSYHPGG
jgi:hypothetical protein